MDRIANDGFLPYPDITPGEARRLSNQIKIQSMCQYVDPEDFKECCRRAEEKRAQRKEPACR